MKFTILALSLLLAAPAIAGKTKKMDRKVASDDHSGTVQVSLTGRNNWIKIEGGAAAAMYTRLKATETSGEGEAGDNVKFKKGKSYRCHTDGSYYACDIWIDAQAGEVKNI